MKKIKNKVIVLIIMISILCTSGLYAVNKENDQNGADASASEIGVTSALDTTAAADDVNTGAINSVNKDETVYVNLNNDGTVSKMNVVNYFRVQESGIYQDYGNYESIINLTNDIEPVIEGDSIRWDLAGSKEDFYYQGQLKGGELPWIFDIDYKLDGVEMKAEDLPGTVGELSITIKVNENNEADEYFRQNYMMQITVPINMQNSTLLSAPGAVQMIAGHTKTLAFTVLPQTSGSFEIKAQVQDFSMDSMDIAMMKADLSAYMDVDEMTTGFGAMSEGMEELANGTVQLKEGITELSGGIGELSEGTNELTLGTPQLSEGMDQFGTGMKTLEDNLEGLSAGSNLMAEGLQGLADNGKELLSGYQGLEDGIDSLLSMKQELSAMAGDMTKSTDPQTAALAQAMLGQLDGMSGLQEGIETLNTNMEQYMQGVEGAAGQYSELNTGINALPGGLNQMYSGFLEIKRGNKAVYSAVDEISGGLSSINDATAAIPSQVQQLADGQIDMKAGIDQAVEEIETLTGTASKVDENRSVSYAAPGKIVPNSVQFVLRTYAIEKISKPEAGVEVETEPENFWDKLLDLFS